MCLRLAKRVLWASLDISLGNILFSNNSLDLIICTTRGDIWPELYVIKLPLRVHELARQHHYCVTLAPRKIASLLLVNLSKEHLIFMLKHILGRLALLKEVGFGPQILWAALTAYCLVILFLERLQT